MKICLIGQNLTNLILAYLFSEKKLDVDIYLNKKIQKVKTNRTIALSSENFDYLKSLTKSNIKHWNCLLYTSDAADESTLCRSRWSPYH